MTSRRSLLKALAMMPLGMILACSPAAPSPPASLPVPTSPASLAAPATPSASVAPSTGPSPAAPPQALGKIATSWNSASGDQVPLWVAKDGGYFDQVGIDADVQYIASTNSMAALLAGQTQFAHVGGSEVLSAVAGGADLVVLAVLGPVYPYALYVSATILQPSDLRGKTLGVSGAGSSSDTALRVTLARLNLVPDKDVNILSVGSTTNLTASLLSGAVVGGMSHPPDTLALEPKGFHVLYDLAQQKLPFANNTVATQRAYLESHRDLAQAYVDAIVRAIAREKSDPTFTIGVMKKYLDSTDDAAMRATWDYYTRQVRPSVPAPRPDQFADTLAELTKKNDRIAALDLGHVLDGSFVDSAAARGLSAP